MNRQRIRVGVRARAFVCRLQTNAPEEPLAALTARVIQRQRL